MAIIQCPECKQEISDQAPACPHCGAPRVQAGTPVTSPPVARGGRGIIWLIILAVVAFVGYRMFGPALEKAGVVPGPRFSIDNAGADESCTVLGDYCMRIHCAVTNAGEGSGVARIAAEYLEDDKVIATHTGTSRLLAAGEHDTLTLDFPEATLASTAHQYRCHSTE